MPSIADIRVALVHLGCARNLIDSETILGRLGAEGYRLTGDVNAADVAVLNTCSFIGPAREESEQVIGDLLARKQAGNLRGVMVVGCLPEKFYEQTARRFPDVDAFLGLSDYSSIAHIVEDVLKGRKVRRKPGGLRQTGQAEGPRLLQTPRSFAYLRPSHGCDHHCAFCIIPAIRGGQRSKPVSTVVAEAAQLVAQGVKEIVLVAEDSTGYGTDFNERGTRLPELVEALAKDSGASWIRVMYAYPNAFPWRLVEVINNHDNVLPYLDIPIQHIASNVLKRMRRGGTRESVERILGRLRREIPGVALRTTVLVGHPGEGEEEFRELLEFLGEFQFERLGAFSFSPEVGTDAADDSERCSPKEAEQRLHELMTLQSEIHQNKQCRQVGRTLPTLVDFHDGRSFAARTYEDAPEVDAVVRVEDPKRQVAVGDLVKVRLTGAEGYDLIGQLEQSCTNHGSATPLALRANDREDHAS